MKEQEIRPKEIFNRYLELSRADGALLDRTQFVQVACPACDEVHKAVQQFKKDGFMYMRCLNCGTLYCSPRPTETQLATIYGDSESARYWSEVFFPSVAEVRREKMFRKKAMQLVKFLTERGIFPETVCDVGAGYGIFLEELQKLLPGVRMSAIEPDPALAERCREKGFETLQAFASGADIWNGRFDLVISSEVVEHVFSPYEFALSLFKLVGNGGTALMTGLGYEGFDILILQEHSNSVFPPHHLNFLSVRGFEIVLTRAGFSGTEVITPGELDVDIVKNTPKCPELVRVAAERGESALSELQDWARRNRISSHVWAFGRR